jgi:hypothetical protein
MLKNLVVLALLLVAHVQVMHGNPPKQYAAYRANPNVPLLAFIQASNSRETAEQTSSNQEGHDNIRSVKVVSMPEKDSFDRTALHVNGGLFIVGLAGVFVALFTWNTIRISSQRQLRAYVFPTDLYMTDGTTLNPPEPHRKDVPGVALIFRNSGQTPAYKLRTWAQIDVILLQNEGQLNIPPMHNQSSHTLGANGTSNKSLWYDRALNATEITEIANGTRGIYVHGRIDYRDAFGKDRFSTFRLVFKEKTFPPTGSSYFTYCDSGNDAN